MLPPLAFVRFAVLIALGVVAAGLFAIRETSSDLPLEAASQVHEVAPVAIARSGLPTPTPELAATSTRTPVPTPTRTKVPTPTPTNTPKPSPTPVPVRSPSSGSGGSGSNAGGAGSSSPPPAQQPPPQAPQQPPPPSGGGNYLNTSYASLVLGLVNNERTSRGLPALSGNGALTNSAGNYALVLMGFSSLSHTANGTTLQGRVAAAGYGGGTLGEVLWQGRGVFAAAAVVQSWMNSPPHRDIILSPAYRDAGVGCAFSTGSQESRCAMDVGAQ